jgi:cytidylate kinase
MSVITISSSFGSSGSVVAQQVATKLGWDLLNRAITVQVASLLRIPLDLAEAHDEQVQTGWHRLLTNLPMSVTGIPESVLTADTTGDEVMLRRATERVLRDAAATDTVVVGRGAAIVLRDRQDALHVRLDGPRQARIRQGAEALGLTLADAEKKLDQTDRARAAYIRELYGLDWRDSALYHLVIDSAALSVDACTKLILAAAHARLGIPSES